MTPQTDLFGRQIEPEKPEPPKKGKSDLPKDAIFFRAVVYCNREWAFRQVKNTIPHIWFKQDKYKAVVSGWTWRPENVTEWLEHLKKSEVIQNYSFDTFKSQNDPRFSEEP